MKLDEALLTLVATVFITSCVSTTSYRPAEDADLAKLRLVAIPGNNISIYKNNESDYISCDFENQNEVAVLGTKANLLIDRKAGRMLGIPLAPNEVPEKQQTELTIEAGVPFSFSFAGVSVAKIHILPPHYTYAYCMQKITFTPHQDDMYEAVYDEAGTGKETTCTAKLYEITEEDGRFVRVEHQDYSVIGGVCYQRY